MRKYDLILWDFNGTLLDDVSLGITCVNLLLTRRGLPTVDSVAAYYRVFSFPVRDYYERLGLWHPGEDYDAVANEWMAEYRAREKETPLRTGAVELIDALHAASYRQGILTATENSMLREQLGYYGLSGRFDFLLGRDDIYAAGKEDIARRFRAGHPDWHILMVGDTDHDCLTARAGGFDPVLIEGGHQSREKLAACGCPVLPDLRALGKWLGVW